KLCNKNYDQSRTFIYLITRRDRESCPRYKYKGECRISPPRRRPRRLRKKGGHRGNGRRARLNVIVFLFLLLTLFRREITNRIRNTNRNVFVRVAHASCVSGKDVLASANFCLVVIERKSLFRRDPRESEPDRRYSRDACAPRNRLPLTTAQSFSSTTRESTRSPVGRQTCRRWQLLKASRHRTTRIALQSRQWSRLSSQAAVAHGSRAPN